MTRLYVNTRGDYGVPVGPYAQQIGESVSGYAKRLLVDYRRLRDAACHEELALFRQVKTAAETFRMNYGHRIGAAAEMSEAELEAASAKTRSVKKGNELAAAQGYSKASHIAGVGPTRLGSRSQTGVPASKRTP